MNHRKYFVSLHKNRQKMKILFLVYHGFEECSGISKKIHYQVKGLRENGHDVRLCHYTIRADGHRCRFVDDDVIQDYGTGFIAALRQRIAMVASTTIVLERASNSLMPVVSRMLIHGSSVFSRSSNRPVFMPLPRFLPILMMPSL